MDKEAKDNIINFTKAVKCFGDWLAEEILKDDFTKKTHNAMATDVFVEFAKSFERFNVPSPFRQASKTHPDGVTIQTWWVEG